MDHWLATEAGCGQMHHHAFWEEKPSYIYSLHNTNIKESSCERDLGITVSSDLRWTKHISKIVKKAEGVLASLNKTIVSRSPAIYF